MLGSGSGSGGTLGARRSVELAYLAGRLRVTRRAGRRVTVRVRFTGMGSVTRSITLPAPVEGTLTFSEIAELLACQAIDDQRLSASARTSRRAPSHTRIIQRADRHFGPQGQAITARTVRVADRIVAR